jgi:hypothetical protein
MRREAPACRPPPSERGGGNSGSAAQNLPRFSSTATTVPPEGSREARDPTPESGSDDLLDVRLPASFPADPAEDLGESLPADLSETFLDFPACLPDGFPACLAVFPRDLRGELT